MAIDKKISELTGVTSLASGALLTGVTANGDNFKILLSDFLSILGVTGSIESLGDGTPVLSVSGDVNRIRAIEGGLGIGASVGPTNTVKLDSTLANGSGGVEILDETSQIIRSLVSDGSLSIATQNGTIQIAVSGTPVTTKTILVNTEVDFGTAIGGIYTLEPDTIYFVTNDITTSNRFVFSDNSVLMSQDQIVMLDYTGTGIMFGGSNVSAKIKTIGVSATDGQLLDFDDNGAHLLTFDEVTVMDCKVIGSVEGFQGAQFTNINFPNVQSTGFIFIGTFGIIAFDAFLVNQLAGDFIELTTSVSSSIIINAGLANMSAGTTFLTGATDSANIAAGGLGAVSGVTTDGAGAALGASINPLNSRWNFSLNSDIPDTRADALLSLTVTDVITIGAANTPVLVAGPWNLEFASQFTITTGGRATYNGEKDIALPIDINASVESVSGVNKMVTIYVAINGSVVTNSGVPNVVGATDPKNTSVPWQSVLTNGDFIEVFIENNTDTVNLNVLNAKLRIN